MQPEHTHTHSAGHVSLDGGNRDFASYRCCCCCASRPPPDCQQMHSVLSGVLQVTRQVRTLAGCEMLSQLHLLKSGLPESMMSLKMSSSCSSQEPTNSSQAPQNHNRRRAVCCASPRTFASSPRPGMFCSRPTCSALLLSCPYLDVVKGRPATQKDVEYYADSPHICTFIIILLRHHTARSRVISRCESPSAPPPVARRLDSRGSSNGDNSMKTVCMVVD